MGRVLPTIEAYQVQHLPIVQASADKRAESRRSSSWCQREGCRARDRCAGPEPRYLEWAQSLVPFAECLAHQDTALLLGQPSRLTLLHDAPVGRVLARLYATGPMQGCTACAVRAEQALHFDKR